MKVEDILDIAGVTDPIRREQAAWCLHLAEKRKKGLLLHKIKVRLFRAGKIAKLIPWGMDRLIDVRPDLASWDIEPVTKITAQGDKGEWGPGPDGGRPIEGEWLNPDPESAEYKLACETNHYSPGLHPRSVKSRTRWYRRNGGAHEAYMRGEIVYPILGHEVFKGSRGRHEVELWRCGGVFLVKVKTKIIGNFGLRSRKGFEVDNVFSGVYSPQAWFPIPGYELRAPLTWSVMPGSVKK